MQTLLYKVEGNALLSFFPQRATERETKTTRLKPLRTKWTTFERLKLRVRELRSIQFDVLGNVIIAQLWPQPLSVFISFTMFWVRARFRDFGTYFTPLGASNRAFNYLMNFTWFPLPSRFFFSPSKSLLSILFFIYSTSISIIVSLGTSLLKANKFDAWNSSEVGCWELVWPKKWTLLQ